MEATHAHTDIRVWNIMWYFWLRQCSSPVFCWHFSLAIFPWERSCYFETYSAGLKSDDESSHKRGWILFLMTATADLFGLFSPAAASFDVIFSSRPQCKGHNVWLELIQRLTRKDVWTLESLVESTLWAWESIYFVMKQPPPLSQFCRMCMFANANRAPKINMQIWGLLPHQCRGFWFTKCNKSSGMQRSCPVPY